MGDAFSDDLNDEATKVSYTSGEIRRLAAALIHAADAADMLDGDLNNAKARREGSGGRGVTVVVRTCRREGCRGHGRPIWGTYRTCPHCGSTTVEMPPQEPLKP